MGKNSQSTVDEQYFTLEPGDPGKPGAPAGPTGPWRQRHQQMIKEGLFLISCAPYTNP